MKLRAKKKLDNRVRLIILVAIGTTVNILLSGLVTIFKIPLWLDTIGTIYVSSMGGVFPGILTAILTNLGSVFFNQDALYYTLIANLIAIVTAWFMRTGGFKKKSRFLIYILALSLLGGVLGMLFQLVLQGKPQMDAVTDTAKALSEHTGLGFYLCAFLVCFGLNIVDKSLSAGIAFGVRHFVPEYIRKSIWQGGWRQKPLSDEEMGELDRKSGGVRKLSLQKKIARLVAAAAAFMAIILSLISLNIYFSEKKLEYASNARKAAEFTAQIVDPTMIDTYLEKGFDARGYEDTRKLMRNIRDNAPGVEYLYVLKIKSDGCYYVFDLETEDVPAYAPGERADFEEAFEEYLPALFAGEEIPDIESNDVSGWVLTTYEPVKNTRDETVCYVGADVSLGYLSHYAGDFVIKIMLIFSGFFVLILSYGLWISRYSLTYPIGSMTAFTNNFIRDDEDQKILDSKVKTVRSLDIHTGDEIEELYRSVSKMASGIAEQMREVRYYSNATAQMQNGLIITMADLVENRDSDTGAHVQKTAAYVKIILEGLKKKGYYLEKLSPQFMSNAVMSAPLHDIGKINIPDAILNKPGKLTDEEYEIMKTHTTAGKEIVEKAINTVKGENYLKEARNMAAYHHERWDGKGYPEKLHGEVIPLSARIMAVADVFDALTSARVYKPPFPLPKALEIIEDGAGTQFDPKCVEAFMDSLSEVKLVLKKYNG